MLKCLVIPHGFRGVKEITLKTNTMNMNAIGKPLGNAITFKYMGELTVERTVRMKAMLECLLFFEPHSKIWRNRGMEHYVSKQWRKASCVLSSRKVLKLHSAQKVYIWL